MSVICPFVGTELKDLASKRYQYTTSSVSNDETYKNIDSRTISAHPQYINKQLNKNGKE